MHPAEPPAAVRTPDRSARPRCAIAIAIAACTALPAYADYAIDWHVIGAGGGSSSAGTLQVSGTIAQATVATSCSGGGACAGAQWQVASGYWLSVPCDTTPDAVFCDAFDRRP